MTRFDIPKLRKDKGMSQSELASLLQITQSFLSAIENGRSPLPIEKEEKLRDIFGEEAMNNYSLAKQDKDAGQKLNELTDSDLFNQLLSRFHKQAHSAESEHHHHDHHQKIDELESKLNKMVLRIDVLFERNEKLCGDNDKLRDDLDQSRREIDRLRSENYQLRTQLLER